MFDLVGMIFILFLYLVMQGVLGVLIWAHPDRCRLQKQPQKLSVKNLRRTKIAFWLLFILMMGVALWAGEVKPLIILVIFQPFIGWVLTQYFAIQKDKREKNV